MKLLAFDTATHACTVSLLSGDQALAVHRIIPRLHSKQLLPIIDDLLRNQGLTIADLDAIACGVGPGSFMGVRLAVSVAQGLALMPACPVIALSTLQILAQTAYEKAGVDSVLPAWDARMEEMYWGGYQVANGIMQPLVDDQLVGPDQWRCPEPLLLAPAVGNAWSVYQHLFRAGPKQLITDDGEPLYPQARAMLQLAQYKLQQGEAIEAGALIPHYIRNKVTYGR